LRAGNQITAVNGDAVTDWYGIMSEDLLAKERGVVALTVLSGGETKTFDLPSESTLTNMSPAMLPLIAQVNAKDPAGIAGVKTGDLVIEVGGKPIKWWHELSETLQAYDGVQTTITVLRNDEPVTMDITPEYTTDYGLNKVVIGVTPGDPGMLPWTMEGNIFEQVGNDGGKIFRLLKALATKSEAKSAAQSLGGPVAIFTMIWFALKLGIFHAIGLIRFININLAVLNLLPIPVLDGGHICFALWEGITRRKVHPKVVGTLVNIFAVLLITAMVFLSWRDADRNWGISRIFKKAPVEQVEAPAPAEPQNGE
jgi:regulator of sigma E protease